MRVINIHKRHLNQPKDVVSLLFNTLATKDDKIWPNRHWPAIYFEKGLEIGSKGGHGIIRYTISAFEIGEYIQFEFTKPDGFIGIHELRLKSISENETEISHKIRMHTSNLKATMLWIAVIRWLHDALIEEAFDKLENHFSELKKETQYNPWVNFLRNRYNTQIVLTKNV